MDIQISNHDLPAANSQASQKRANSPLVDGSQEPKSDGQNAVVDFKAPVETEQELTQRLENTVDQLNTIVQSVQRNLHFSVDEQSGDTVIKVLDTKTEEVIRQIPSEEVLAVAQNIESLKGILFSAEV